MTRTVSNLCILSDNNYGLISLLKAGRYFQYFSKNKFKTACETFSGDISAIFA